MLTELAFIIGIGTTHVFYNDHYNNENQLIMVQYDNWTAGTMINSYNNRSFMAGYDFNIQAGGSRWGVMVGGVTGYDKDYIYDYKGELYIIKKENNSPITPMVALYVRAPLTDHVHAQINFLGSAINLSTAITF